METSIADDKRPRKIQKWIIPSYFQHCSGVEEIQAVDEPAAYVSITMEVDDRQLEEFDYIDELIIYIVGFLRQLRNKLTKSHQELSIS